MADGRRNNGRKPTAPETRACMVRIGERLKQCRKARGLSLREAAPLLGISAMALSNWERGQVNLTSTLLLRAGDVYGVKASWLMAAVAAPTIRLEIVHWHREGDGK